LKPNILHELLVILVSSGALVCAAEEPSETAFLFGSLSLSLPLKNRYLAAFPSTSRLPKPAVFALSGLPVHLAASPGSLDSR